MPTEPWWVHRLDPYFRLSEYTDRSFVVWSKHRHATMQDFGQKENEGLPLVKIRVEQPFGPDSKAKFASGCVMIKGIPSQSVFILLCA